MPPAPDVAIAVDNLSKHYRLGPTSERADSLRDAIWSATVGVTRFIHRAIARERPPAAERQQDIWALQNVSFEVHAGEVLGIVGPNGAGKSTLLKILSRIIEPTEGRVQMVGRVGSLLEVGTGFHPDLTGRENVYLNGAILGMRKTEIDRKLDEIVEFAEVSRFIDTPVKHYSSGMYLRLAFAVGAHLETEILLVDEVLAVGDARFQEKCLDKMRDVGRHGRTVLFVSHNLLAVKRLCERAILVDGGKIWKDGPSEDVVSAYLNAGRDTTARREWPDDAKAPGRGVVRLRAVRARTADGGAAEGVDIRRGIAVEMEYDVLEGGHILLPNFQFYNDDGIHMFASHDLDPAWNRRRRPAGRYVSTVRIPGNLLSEGPVIVSVGMETVAPKLFQFYVNEAVSFRVIDTLDGDSARGDYIGKISGIVRPRLEWTTELLSP
jgi:lipopolysaccharide transport system ATP-binding protein